MSLNEYTIKFEYDGISPVCQCGFCTDTPEFYRGKFKLYTKGHTSANWHQRNYIKKYGNPTCEECGITINFSKGRKTFPRFCSFICSGTHNKDIIIEKMKPKIIEKFKDPKYKEKISNALKLRFTDPLYYMAHVERTTKYNKSEESRKIKSINSKLMWSEDTFKIKQSIRIKYATNLPIETARRSACQQKRMQDPIIREMYCNILRSVSKQYSKLHIRLVDALKLRSLGFTGEQQIGNYCVDELHKDKKIIIEINGDYVHANPKYYFIDDIIQMPGNSYTAEMKWDKDRIRQEKLESLGYAVFVIWESDSIDEIKERLHNLLH